MHPFYKTDRCSSKLYVSGGTLPSYIDPKQPPTKKQPFGTIANQHFTHTVLGATVDYSYLAEKM